MWTRLFVFAVCTTMYVAILVPNDGKLTYALDDAYVHLSVSEQIWRGGYHISASAAGASAWPS